MNNNDDLIDVLAEPAETLCQAAKAMTIRALEENAAVSPDSLAAAVREMPQHVVLEGPDGMTIRSKTNESTALSTRNEVEAITEAQRAKMIQYEQDKAFFEKEVLKASRSVGEIQDDYIKILHPTYRQAFLKGLSTYGTIAAGLKYMKEMYGLKVRGDVLDRIKYMIPVFKQEIEDALAEYQATIQMELHRRAIEGVDKGVYYNGEQIGTEKVYSDALLVKLADVHTPEYKEAKTKSNERGNTINVQIIKDFHNYKKD